MMDPATCGLCNKQMTFRALQKHLGHHQEELALFAVPPNLDEKEDDHDEQRQGDKSVPEGRAAEEPEDGEDTDTSDVFDPASSVGSDAVQALNRADALTARTLQAQNLAGNKHVSVSQVDALTSWLEQDWISEVTPHGRLFDLDTASDEARVHVSSDYADVTGNEEISQVDERPITSMDGAERSHILFQDEYSKVMASAEEDHAHEGLTLGDNENPPNQDTPGASNLRNNRERIKFSKENRLDETNEGAAVDLALRIGQSERETHQEKTDLNHVKLYQDQEESVDREFHGGSVAKEKGPRTERMALPMSTEQVRQPLESNGEEGLDVPRPKRTLGKYPVTDEEATKAKSPTEILRLQLKGRQLSIEDYVSDDEVDNQSKSLSQTVPQKRDGEGQEHNVPDRYSVREKPPQTQQSFSRGGKQITRRYTTERPVITRAQPPRLRDSRNIEEEYTIPGDTRYGTDSIEPRPRPPRRLTMLQSTTADSNPSQDQPLNWRSQASDPAHYRSLARSRQLSRGYNSTQGGPIIVPATSRRVSTSRRPAGSVSYHGDVNYNWQQGARDHGPPSSRSAFVNMHYSQSPTAQARAPQIPSVIRVERSDRTMPSARYHSNAPPRSRRLESREWEDDSESETASEEEEEETSNPERLISKIPERPQLGRRSSMSRTPLVPAIRSDSSYDIRAIVEGSRSSRRESIQASDETFENLRTRRQENNELPRTKRSSRIYDNERLGHDYERDYRDDEDDEDLTPITRTPIRRLDSRTDPRRLSRPVVVQAADAEGHTNARRWEHDTLADQSYALKQAKSARSSGEDSDETSNEDNNGEIRLLMGNDAPVTLRLNGGMEGRSIWVEPGENGQNELVIGGNRRAGDSTYRSERGSIRNERRGIVQASRARREAEEMSERSFAATRRRRDARGERDEPRRVLRQRRERQELDADKAEREEESGGGKP